MLPNKVLIIRFSAMGDVAMTIPVLYALAEKNPDTQFTMLTRNSFKPMFIFMPTNLTFWGVNLQEYQGLCGLERLYKEAYKQDFDAIVDLHDVLRTKYLRIRFTLKGIQTAKINKGRAEKKDLVNPSIPIKRTLPSSFERYQTVFKKLGFTQFGYFQSVFAHNKPSSTSIETTIGEIKKDSDVWIGIAPFAKHRAKIYPIEQMEKVLAYFATQHGIKLFLFGGGPEETAILERWEKSYTNTISCAKKLTLEQELILMGNLNLMVSMDSANMHLASLVGTKVVSIWGGTHPFAGFLGWGQKTENILQIDMNCRPCSIYGNKPCLRGDYACMQQITPQFVIEKIKTALNKQLKKQ